MARGGKPFAACKRDGVSARIADGAFVHVHYPTVSKLARAFAPDFRVKSIKGIGIAVPPSYVEPWAQRHPRLLELLRTTDSVLGRFPGIRLLGDQCWCDLQREHSTLWTTERDEHSRFHFGSSVIRLYLADHQIRFAAGSRHLSRTTSATAAA